MRPKLLALAAALLPGCATTLTEPPAAAPFRALGTEPFWSVTVAEGRLTYETPEGPPLSMAAPVSRQSGAGRVYETGRLVMEVMPGECSDGMSDRRYADRVTVRIDGRTLNGCGGAILAPERLAGTSWSIVEMDGAPVGGEAYHLHFTEDRLSGQAGCNRFSGPYSESDGTIVPGPIAATRMACPGPRMAHERLMLELLGGPVRFEHPDGDSLRLSGPTGSVRLRRSI